MEHIAVLKDHNWKIGNILSELTTRIVSNSSPELTLIVKPIRYVDPGELPIAANEYICHRLIKLIQSKGIETNTPKVSLVPAERKIFKSNIYVYHGVAIIDDLMKHSRISLNTDIEKLNKIDGINWPSWLYWFDMWIGRLDSSGDTNLLLVGGTEIIPVDFSMVFHWACGDKRYVHKIDYMDINIHPEIEKRKTEKSRQIIKSLTDEEIWDAVVSDIPKEFISSAALVAYWSGLCFRRDLI